MAGPASHRSPAVSCYLLLLVLAAANAAAERTRILSLQSLPWLEKRTPMSACPAQQSGRRSEATIFEMRRHDYCGGEKQSWEERVNGVIHFDEERVRSFQAMAAAGDSSAVARQPVVSGAKLHTLNYVVVVELGWQRKTLIVDTGSDLTWVQCRPCFYCYTQRDPLFDPTASASYSPVPCNSAACGGAGTGAAVCSGEQTTCRYSVAYGDGSYSRGELARERIVLGGAALDGFVFGCGRSNRGLFGGAAGLMGLGRSDLSLIRQSLQLFRGFFSYCLPSGDSDSTGELALGGDFAAYQNSTPLSFTRLLPNDGGNPFYLVNLTGAAVGGAAVSAAGFSTGRVLVDSGTVITRLVPSVYAAVREEFLRQFSGYPAAPSFSILDTCFDLSGHDEVAVPTVRMKFEGGAEMKVDVGGVFYFAKRDASQVCLAMASLAHEDQMGIIGNYQQKNMRVVYDTQGGRIGFAEEACGYRG